MPPLWPTPVGHLVLPAGKADPGSSWARSSTSAAEPRQGAGGGFVPRHGCFGTRRFGTRAALPALAASPAGLRGQAAPLDLLELAFPLR